MPPTTTEPTLLDKLYEQRTTMVDAWSELVAARETERASFEERRNSADEAQRPDEAAIELYRSAEAAFKADSDQRKAEISEQDLRIADQEDIVRRRAEAAKAHRGVPVVTSEPLTYRRDNGRGMEGISYYRDLAITQVEGVTFATTTRDQSLARLTRHAQEMDVEIPRRVEAAQARARAALDTPDSRGGSLRGINPFHQGANYNPVEQRVEPGRTDGYGGYFVSPLWIPEEYIPGLRAHSVAADLCRQLDLPPGTDSINIPKLANLTAVGYQTADNSGVLSQDWSDTFVQANVKTAAGQSDVALQLLEQSPNGITDEVITTDLMAAYNQFVDQQVIAGDGVGTGQLAGGHIQGLYPANNWGANAVTYTDGSPTGQHFVSVLGVMASQIARNRFDLANLKFVLNGRRWFWYATSLDTNGRPLVNSQEGSPYNIPAEMLAELPAEGLSGTTNFGAPVYVDDNVPTNDTSGGGSSQDVAIAALWDDMWLFKGDLRTAVYREVLSGSLGVRFQVYNYFAFLARYGQSIAIATGSGFAAPQGSVSTLLF
jgi:HK97 family phage major capsid protein